MLPNEPALMTLAELARTLRRSRQGVYDLIDRGDAPPSLIVGRRRLFPRSWVEEWLSGKRRDGTGRPT
jgi:excisionase family DNA binding protein